MASRPEPLSRRRLGSESRLTPFVTPGGTDIGTHPGNDLAHRRPWRKDLSNAHLGECLPIGIRNDATAEDHDVIGIGLMQQFDQPGKQRHVRP